MKPRSIYLATALCAFTFTCTAAEGVPAAPKLAPEADAVLKAASDFYKGLKSSSAGVTLTILQQAPGKPENKMVVKSTLAAAKPNLFAFRLTESPEGTLDFISDGKTVWTHVAPLKQFMVDDAPTTLEALLSSGNAGLNALSQMGMLADLYRADPYRAIFDGVQALSFAGVEKVGDVECSHLKAEQPTMDWDAWFEKGDKPALKKFTFSPLKGMLANAPEEAKAQMKGAKLEINVELADWKLNTDLPAATFAFEPPKDAKKVKEFAPEEGGETSPADAMKGTPAPDFSLALLTGEKMQLASHKGKDVVILDFWATWCGPCVKALPIVSEVAAMYKDKGVAFYAVNQGEEAADVKKFIESKKLAITVAMDTDGAVAKLFKVQGIPQTVIIGKDGKVAAVHVGFSGNLKEMLTKQLDEALTK